jgi:hypothetical protein
MVRPRERSGLASSAVLATFVMRALLSHRGHFAVIAMTRFTVRSGKIVEIDILADPARLRQLDVGALHD